MWCCRSVESSPSCVLLSSWLFLLIMLLFLLIVMHLKFFCNYLYSKNVFRLQWDSVSVDLELKSSKAKNLRSSWSSYFSEQLQVVPLN